MCEETDSTWGSTHLRTDPPVYVHTQVLLYERSLEFTELQQKDVAAQSGALHYLTGM